MTPDDRNDGSKEEDTPGFVRTVLSGLFETIVGMDERGQRQRSGTGTARRGDSGFDYGLSIGIGPGTTTKREDASETPADHAATVHETDEGYVVTLDLPDVDPRELAAGVDAGTGRLVVAAEDVIERVPLPDGNLEVGDASFNNGILDVHLRATGGDV